MIYSSALSAVVSALAAECIANTAKQAWQKLYQAGEARPAGIAVSAEDRMAADCWVFARLHHGLKPRHWFALVAKYSTHKARKVDAIGKLVSVVATPAPLLFLHKAVTAWAIPPLKGAQPQRAKALDAADPRCHGQEWRERATKLNAARSWRVEAEKAGRSSDMIVLPASFYDMNTWDVDGRPEQTRRRWRGGIRKVLDEMVGEAVAEAERILAEEGVLISRAA